MADLIIGTPILVILLTIIILCLPPLFRHQHKREEEMAMWRWTCHVCNRERPDAKISVYSKPLVINGQVVGTQNIRYCNDNPECIQRAPEVDHFGWSLTQEERTK